MNCVRYGIPLSPIYVQFNFLRYVLRLKLFTLHTRTMLGLLKRHQQLGDALPCPTPFHIIYAHLFIHYTYSPHLLLPPPSALRSPIVGAPREGEHGSVTAPCGGARLLICCCLRLFRILTKCNTVYWRVFS